MSSQFDQGYLGIQPNACGLKRLESQTEAERLMVGNGRVLFVVHKLNDGSFPPNLSAEITGTYAQPVFSVSMLARPRRFRSKNRGGMVRT